jgi:hypothetical protein
MENLPEKTILIEASGGLIDAVYGDDESIKVLLIDWDEVEAARDKEPMAALVARFALTPSEEMPVTTLEILKQYANRDE